MLFGIGIFVFLIIVHEYGHFIAAKRNGVEVEEFGLGLPPKLFGKKLGRGIWRTYYTFNLLPIGGFVKLKGEHELDKRKGDYGAAKFRSKVKIIMAGVAMNALVAVAIFTIQAWTGMPQLFENQYRIENYVTSENKRVAVGLVAENSPAEEIGLLPGDILVSVEDFNVSTEENLIESLGYYKSNEATVRYQSGGKDFEKLATLASGEGEDGILGVVPVELSEVKYNPLVAPIVGIGTAIQFSALTINGFATSIWHLISGNFVQAAENVTGPVGIFAIFTSLSNVGMDYLIFFGAIISMTLAILNILPLPALDGGRLTMSYLINSKKFKISRKREELIHVIGFVTLLILALLITMVDIGRF